MLSHYKAIIATVTREIKVTNLLYLLAACLELKAKILKFSQFFLKVLFKIKIFSMTSIK